MLRLASLPVELTRLMINRLAPDMTYDQDNDQDELEREITLLEDDKVIEVRSGETHRNIGNDLVEPDEIADRQRELTEQEVNADQVASARTATSTMSVSDLSQEIEIRNEETSMNLQRTGSGADSPVVHYYRKEALEHAWRHAKEYSGLEVGGVLLGLIRHGNNKEHIYTVVTGIIRADQAIGREASLRFTPDAWLRILTLRDQHPIYHDETIWQIVGWYHTHPNFGIFFSSADVHTHRTFTHHGHIALVMDPVRGEMGTFGWNHDMSSPVRLNDYQPGVSRSKGDFPGLTDKKTLGLVQQIRSELTELPPAEIAAHLPTDAAPSDREDTHRSASRNEMPPTPPPRDNMNFPGRN